MWKIFERRDIRTAGQRALEIRHNMLCQYDYCLTHYCIHCARIAGQLFLQVAEQKKKHSIKCSGEKWDKEKNAYLCMKSGSWFQASIKTIKKWEMLLYRNAIVIKIKRPTREEKETFTFELIKNKHNLCVLKYLLY